MEKGKLEDALKMIELGMGTEEIAKITGLAPERIERLRKQK